MHAHVPLVTPRAVRPTQQAVPPHPAHAPASTRVIRTAPRTPGTRRQRNTGVCTSPHCFTRARTVSSPERPVLRVTMWSSPVDLVIPNTKLALIFFYLRASTNAAQLNTFNTPARRGATRSKGSAWVGKTTRSTATAATRSACGRARRTQPRRVCTRCCQTKATAWEARLQTRHQHPRTVSGSM